MRGLKKLFETCDTVLRLCLPGLSDDAYLYMLSMRVPGDTMGDALNEHGDVADLVGEKVKKAFEGLSGDVKARAWGARGVHSIRR